MTNQTCVIHPPLSRQTNDGVKVVCQASSTSSLAYPGKDAPNMEDYKIALRTDQTGFLERPKEALWSGLE